MNAETRTRIMKAQLRHRAGLDQLYAMLDEHAHAYGAESIPAVAEDPVCGTFRCLIEDVSSTGMALAMEELIAPQPGKDEADQELCVYFLTIGLFEAQVYRMQQVLEGR